MRSITNIIIRFIELLEAEGRSFRRGAVAAAENITVIFFSLMMIFAGIAVASFSLYLWLSLHIGRVGASAVIAVLLLAGGAYTLSIAHSRGLSGEPLFSRDEDEKALKPTGSCDNEQQ